MIGKIKFGIDALVFAGFLIAFEPHFTGLSAHEWLMLSGIAVVIAHILLHWDWLFATTTRFFQSMPNRVRVNYVLVWLVFVGMITVIVSGLMVSESVSFAFGFDWISDTFWRRIHSLASNLTFLLVALHFALHWDWIKRAFHRKNQT